MISHQKVTFRSIKKTFAFELQKPERPTLLIHSHIVLVCQQKANKMSTKRLVGQHAHERPADEEYNNSDYGGHNNIILGVPACAAGDLRIRPSGHPYG
jgi:hypothetical protein